MGRVLAAAGAALFTCVATGAATAELPHGEPVAVAQSEELAKTQRQRVRDCGAEWQRVKAAGKGRRNTWKRFQADCLKRKG